MEVHEGAPAMLGVGADRPLVQTVTQEVKDAGNQLPFVTRWTSLQKCKALSQWRSKLVSLGAKEADVKNLGLKQIG
eukprot:3505303-Pyramimonas_sp.AAC.1